MVHKAWIGVIAALLPLAAWANAPATEPGSATQPASTTEPIPSTQPSSQVLALIDQMGAVNFQSRMHAQMELVAVGAAAEPALRRAATDSPSAEIRDRAAVAVSQIEQIIAAAPTFISLHVKNAAGEDVLKEISRQAKVRVLGWPNAAWKRQGGNIPLVTLDLDHVPFLAALEAVCKATHTHPQNISQGSPSDISLVHGDFPKWDQQGRFAFVPCAINHDRQMDLVNGGAIKNDAISMEVYLDPKIQSIDWDQPVIDSAVDDRGHSLIPPPGAARPMMGFMYRPGFQRQWLIDTQSQLEFPAVVGTKLARLDGTLTLRFPREMETLRIPDLVAAVGTATVVGNHKVDVLACGYDGKNGINLHFQIGSLSPQGDSVPGGLMQEFTNARIVDSTGQQLLPNGGGGGGNALMFDWQGTYIGNGARAIKPPFSLQWEIVSRVESVTVPFKFKDLPLPPQ